MNEPLDIEYEFLWKLLANPADPTHSYIFDLQSLVTDFPHSGILRALLMPNGDKRNLKHAAAYFDPVILHKLATAPDSLPAVTAEQIVQSDEPLPVPADIYIKPPLTEPFVPPVIEPAEEISVSEEGAEEAIPVTDTLYQQERIISAYLGDDEQEEDTTTVTNQENTTYTPIESENAGKQADVSASAAEPVTDEVPQQHETEVDPTTEALQPATELPAEESSEDNSPANEQSSLAREYEDYMAKTEYTPTEEEPAYAFEDKIEYFHQDIEDEIYDEIVSIEDISLEQLAILNKEANKEEERTEVTSAELQEPVKDSYFVFEPPLEVSADEVAENKAETMAVPVAGAKSTQQGETGSNVSRYNDEKMPYTFMWWLDKTRKEHADVYQPYVSNGPPAPPKQNKTDVADELQQQYYETIVSISSLTELDQKPAAATGTATPSRKEDKIIERFIQQEPQIKHPSGIKLDNENKAKKSSEDKDELVTETLARIYTEQMLYHKAILTYKKLMLKYPEKSLYFAGQIEQLENKIN